MRSMEIEEMNPGLVISVILATYLTPAFLAMCFRNRDRQQILLLNVYFGWTLIGWLSALRWAWDRKLRGPAVAETLATCPAPTLGNWRRHIQRPY
jgi:hypothetical protein